MYYVKCNSSHGGPEYFQFRDSDPSWFFEEGAGALVDMGVHGLQAVTSIMRRGKENRVHGKDNNARENCALSALDGKVIRADKIP